MQALPGFRDFYPEDCARRNYIVSTWRKVARRYGFVEFDGPTLEPLDLYAKKNSGGEILGQLFNFTDKGDRPVALRPEMTPTLARMVAAKSKDYRKPLKWFCASPFFRYEKQQKGRLREFWQFNADLIGEGGPGADAEVVALAVDLLREFGFGKDDFVVRLSDRRAWQQFLADRSVDPAVLPDFLSVVDKLERDAPEAIEARLGEMGVALADVRAFIADGGGAAFDALFAELDARGVREFVQPDLTIVRGLAYYTGLVFEVFDRSRKLRALAGGGRYDRLLADLSDGACDLPALGFGMGDVSLGNFIDEVPAAAARRDAFLRSEAGAEIVVVIAEETQRAPAIALAQSLRAAGWRTDYSLVPAKVGRQFQDAEKQGARFAVVVGSEWPVVKLKLLATRAEESIPHDALVDRLKSHHV